MTVKAYIHSLKDHEHDRHMLGEAEIVNRIKGGLQNEPIPETAGPAAAGV